MGHLTDFEVVLVIASAISFVYGYYKFFTKICIKHGKRKRQSGIRHI